MPWWGLDSSRRTATSSPAGCAAPRPAAPVRLGVDDGANDGRRRGRHPVLAHAVRGARSHLQRHHLGVQLRPIAGGVGVRLRNLHPARRAGALPEFITRQIDGMADAGIRFVTSVRLDDEQLPEADAFDAFGVAMAPGHRRPTIDPRWVGVRAVQWSSAAVTAEREHEMMTRYGVTNQAHFVETAEQLDIQQNKFDWYDQSGCLGTDFAFGHFVHPTSRMVERVVETGSSVVWQPMSNGRLGSGICDTPHCSSVASESGWVSTTSRAPICPTRSRTCAPVCTCSVPCTRTPRSSPLDMLTLHTIGSARAIGVDDRVGSLEVGKYADFLVVDPTNPPGTDLGSVATYVLACGLRNLAEVVIGGTTAWCRDQEQPLRTEADEQATARMIAAGAVSGFTPVR